MRQGTRIYVHISLIITRIYHSIKYTMFVLIEYKILARREGINSCSNEGNLYNPHDLLIVVL